MPRPPYQPLSNIATSMSKRSPSYIVIIVFMTATNNHQSFSRSTLRTAIILNRILFGNRQMDIKVV